MKSGVQAKIKAISLRMQGFSYSEIMKEIPVSKSTLFGWLRHIQLTNEQKTILDSNLRQKKSFATVRAAESNTKRRIQREYLTKEIAQKTYEEYSKNIDFLVGLTLYWAEGTKKDTTWSFINSDPDMVLFMYKWMIRYLIIDKKDVRIRLFIHEPYKEENLEYFWAQLLGIDQKSMQHTIYKPTPRINKKNPLYKGCVRMYVTGIEHFRTVIQWKEMLVNSLKV